jgi:hypothetical protein
MHIGVPIKFSQSLVHRRPTLLTKLTMEYNNSFHHSLNRLFIFEKEFMHITRVGNIDGVLNVPTLILIVESAIYYEVGLLRFWAPVL